MIKRRIELCDKIPMYRLILLDYSLGNGFDGPDVASAMRVLIQDAGVQQPYICCCTAY